MKRINQYQFYQLGMVLHPLSDIAEGANLQALAWDFLQAKAWLQWLLAGRLGEISVSREPAIKLLQAITMVLPDVPGQSVFAMPPIATDRVIDYWSEAYGIISALKEFETVFAAELPTFATYMVSKKGIYSTQDLTEQAELAIDERARSVLSQDSLRDFREAGRCLAFELSTGAGFHTMRAVESVLRFYWSLVKKQAGGGKPPEMAQCIKELRADGEDPKLMDILDHIRDLHRNTIMHPEAFLEMTDALRLFDISKSAISAMGDRIKVLNAGVAAQLTVAPPVI